MLEHTVLQRLAEHQARARELTDRAWELVQQIEPGDAATLAMLRWQMVREMAAYESFKQTQVYDPLIASCEGANKLAVQKLKQDCLDLSAAFRGYVGKWSSVDKVGHWPEYRQAALDIIQRLRRQMSEESAVVARLAARPCGNCRA
jgi:hypothetical protein